MLQNSQNWMQSKAACCGTRTWLATFRRNILSPFSDMREETFYFLFVFFFLRLFVVCLLLSFFLSYSNEWDLKFYTTQHIRPSSYTGRLSMNDCEVKLLTRSVSAANITALNYTLLLAYLQIIFSIVSLNDFCFVLIKPEFYY